MKFQTRRYSWPFWPILYIGCSDDGTRSLILQWLCWRIVVCEWRVRLPHPHPNERGS